MSKIIIFEALDNCFKTTNTKSLFNFYMENGKTSHQLHYSGAKNINGDKALKLSKKLYKEMFETFEYFFNKDINVLVDRSHLGENVYAHYRNYDPAYIWKLEKKFSKKEFWDNIYLIYMKDDPKNAISRDDGESFTTDINKKIYERKKFEEAYILSKIPNKYCLEIINKTRDEIFSEILSFLGEESIENKISKCANEIFTIQNSLSNIEQILKKYME